MWLYGYFPGLGRKIIFAGFQLTGKYPMDRQWLNMVCRSWSMMFGGLVSWGFLIWDFPGALFFICCSVFLIFWIVIGRKCWFRRVILLVSFGMRCCLLVLFAVCITLSFVWSNVLFSSWDIVKIFDQYWRNRFSLPLLSYIFWFWWSFRYVAFALDWLPWRFLIVVQNFFGSVSLSRFAIRFSHILLLSVRYASWSCCRMPFKRWYLP